MNILTSLQKLAGSLKRRASGGMSTGIVAALAVCATTSAQAQVTVSTLGGGPGSADISGVGNAIITFSGGTGTGAGIKLDNPLGMAFDTTGNLYIAENAQGNILKVTNPGNRATSFTYLFVTGLNSPVAVAVASNGDVYALSSGDGSIRKYTSEGVFVSVITAALVNPTSFVILSDGSFVVTEIGGSVKKVTSAGVVTVLNATFVNPTGISLYTSDRVAIADGGDHSIRILNLTNTASVTLLAGGNGAGFTNGLALTAQFNTPRNISYAPNGSLVVADQNNNRVRLITPDGRVDTVYGVSTNSWPDNPFYPTYPGWKDGTNAHANQPFGVIVAPGASNIFVTEIGHTLDLLRVTSGFSLAAPTGTNDIGNGVVNTNNTEVVMTLGFATGEASSDYIASPGQFFQVPVTLTLPTTQKIYSLTFLAAVTNVGGSPLTKTIGQTFQSKLVRPVAGQAGLVTTVSNGFFLGFFRTNVYTNFLTGLLYTNVEPALAPGVLVNAAAQQTVVGWFEIPTANNLFPSDQQHLVSESQAHINLFTSASQGRAILGSFGFQIPVTAPIGTEYRVEVTNASASMSLNQAVSVVTPALTNLTALSAGNANSIKRIIVQAPKPFLVGDIETFRWYNAGEFGNGKIEAIDVQEVLMASIYGNNYPLPTNSDFFNTFDSYDAGTGIDPVAGNVDLVHTGDTFLTVGDVFTTWRRSVDPSLQWVYRFPGGIYASNGPGVGSPGFALSSVPAAQLTAVPVAKTVLNFSVGDTDVSSGSINVPIIVKVRGSTPLKAMWVSATVEPINGAPDLSEAVGYTAGSMNYLGLPNDQLTIRRGNNNVSISWLNLYTYPYVPGLPEGDHVIATLTIKPSRALLPGESYRVRLDNVSAGPEYAFQINKQNGLVASNVSLQSSVGDAIPDAWRLKYFGKIFSQETLADADPDGDGISNLDEFRAGTNPNDAASVFKLTKPDTAVADGVKIRFVTVAGKDYQVECSNGLGTGWQQLGFVVHGTGGEVVVNDTSNGASGKFYRIKIVDATSASQ